MRILTGKKTKFGLLMIFAGGVMYIGSVWCPVLLDRVSIGIIVMGAAIAWYGYTNRFNRVFYMINSKGNPDTTRPRLKKRRLHEGDMEGGMEDG